MKITFIRPHSSVPSAAPPMAFLSLAAYLQNQGGNHEFNIIDGRAKLLDAEKIKPLIKGDKPDIIGITAFSMEKNETHKVAEMAKSLFPEVPVVVGGPYTTADWRMAVSDPNVDYAVVSEGEVSFSELVASLEAGEKYPEIKGLAYKRNGELVYFGYPEFIKDLDEIPITAWDLIDLEFYFYNKRKRSSMNPHQRSSRSAPVVTSRGCPYQCNYCHNVFGKKQRFRSVENVIEELIYLKQEKGIEEIDIIDDIFNLNRPRAKQLCDRIVEEKLNIGIAFPNGLRVDQMDEELVDKLKAAGCYRIQYAIETGSPELQKKIGKRLNLEKAKAIIEYTARRGISVGGFFMMGFLDETEEQMKMTIDFALKSKLHTASFFVVQPFPNTRLFDEAVEKGYKLNGFPEEHYYRVSHNISSVSIEKIYKLRGEAVRKFYFNPIRVWRFIRTTPLKYGLWIKTKLMLSYLFQDNPEAKKGAPL